MNQVTAPANLPTASVPCPRCKQPLIDPKGLGWCKACGYCHSLTELEPRSAAAVPENPGALDQLGATGQAIGQAPTWVWILFAGIIIVVAGNFALGRYVVLTPYHRALLTTVLIVAGVLIMLIGQFIGVLKVAPDDPTLSFKDAVFPFRLYGLVMKRLPSTQMALYLGVWGLTAALSAGILIGGVGHWLTYLPDSKKTHKKAK